LRDFAEGAVVVAAALRVNVECLSVANTLLDKREFFTGKEAGIFRRPTAIRGRIGRVPEKWTAATHEDYDRGKASVNRAHRVSPHVENSPFIYNFPGALSPRER